MAYGLAARTLRVPGQLVVGPTEEFAGGTFPYGGKPIGRARMCVLRPSGEPLRVPYESTGEIGEILDPGQNWTFACFLRGADDEAIELLLGGNTSPGDRTGHPKIVIPGDRFAGRTALGRSVSIAYVPEDLAHGMAMIVYRAVPLWADAAELEFRRSAEFGIPLTFECLRDSQGRIAQIGRLHDLDLPA